MYAVLKPIYTPANEKQFSVSWQKVGTADNMEEAKRKYGGVPVLSAEPQYLK